ncbi:MAG: diguanylate cyclase [Thermoanaerobaculia bacterium]|nr:diguanylate cyclase [Thermoanaerobaculia bacterium]
MSDSINGSAILVGFVDAGPVEAVRNAGFTARSAPPWAALQAIREGDCDLLVVRLTGAFRDVFDLVETARTERVPVVASVTAEEGERQRAFETGASDCIVEPFSDLELIEKLRIQAELVTLRGEVGRLRAELGRAVIALDEARGAATLQSMHDDLTGVGNVKRFYTAMELEWKRAARTGTSVSLLLADIDQFRLYNERSGHASGDDCLRSVADALSAGISRAGDLLARYGGEEFVVVLPSTAHDAALAVAQRLAQSVRELSLPHEASAAGIVTVSIGVATAEPSETSSPAVLVAAAEEAMRAAKAAGRNRVVGRHAR